MATTKHRRRRPRVPGEAGDTGTGARETGERSGIKKKRSRIPSWRSPLTWGILCMTAGFSTCFFLWSDINGDPEVTEVLAAQSDVLNRRFYKVPCSEDYNKQWRFPGILFEEIAMHMGEPIKRDIYVQLPISSY